MINKEPLPPLYSSTAAPSLREGDQLDEEFLASLVKGRGTTAVVGGFSVGEIR